jgi:hypothetical protein
MDDRGAFDRKHHDDREEKKNQSQRADFRNEMFTIPGFPFAPGQNLPGNKARGEWDAQVDADTFRDLTNRDVNDSST